VGSQGPEQAPLSNTVWSRDHSWMHGLWKEIASVYLHPTPKPADLPDAPPGEVSCQASKSLKEGQETKKGTAVAPGLNSCS
jgi:hypothetical protein